MELWEEFSFLEDGYDYIDPNSLYSWCKENGERGELLLKEWDLEKNLNVIDESIEPRYVSATDVKTYWWKCSTCGHSYKSAPYRRTKMGHNCRYCGNKSRGFKERVNASKNGNDLMSWCENNGDFGSALLKEWDYEKNSSDGIEIDEISARSGKGVHWICQRCGKDFEKKVYLRVSARSGCPHCNRIGTSYPEQFIYRAIKRVYGDTCSRVKLFDCVEYDIYIPCKKVAIEYNGSYWHEKKEERDNYKKQLCLENGVRFFKVYADNGKIGISYDEDDIAYNISDKKHDRQLKEITCYILERIGCHDYDIDFSEVANEAQGQMVGEIEDNFTKYAPELVKEWDVGLNNGMKPEFFTKGSHQRIKWKCKKCGGIFENSIDSRIKFRSGCRFCGYNIFDNKSHYHARKEHLRPIFGAHNL